MCDFGIDYERIKNLVMFLNSQYLDVQYFIVNSQNINEQINQLMVNMPTIHIYCVYPVEWSFDNPPFLTRQAGVSSRMEYVRNNNSCVLFIVVDCEI